MRRGAAILVLLLSAGALGGCASEPRLGSTFSIRTDLTVEESLWAKQNLPRLEAAIVRRIEEIDPAEIYRATIIDNRWEDDLPYQMLTQSIQMQVSQIELRHHLPRPDAWMHITLTIRRLTEDPFLDLEGPQVRAWAAFLKRFEAEVQTSQALLAKTLKGGDPWISTMIRKADPRRKPRTEGRYMPPPEDGGFWNLGKEEAGPQP